MIIQVEGKTAGSVIAGIPAPFDDDLFKRFFGDRLRGIPRMPQPETPRGERRAIGQGSGFVFAAKDGLVSDKTYILTNNHVVEGAAKIRVKFQDGRQFDAKVKGRDPQPDVAVVEIQAGGLPALDWGDSAQLDVGEWVAAIGNPFGLSHSRLDYSGADAVSAALHLRG